MSTVTRETGPRHVVVLTLDNPPVNALSWSSRADLAAALADLDADTDVRAVVLTGRGRTFTAGADLGEDQRMTDGQVPDFLVDFDRVVNALEHLRVPVIAAVNGPAVGGGLEVALACDIRIASTEASFVAAGVNVGLMANFWRLSRTVGLGPAKEMLLTGERYDAQRALAWGLVTEVHPPGELLAAALAKAQRIATRAPLSVEAAKRCAAVALDLDHAEAERHQSRELTALFATADHREALRAFFGGSVGDYQRR